MRTLFVTDIHGQYDSFMELLQEANWDIEKDKLILGGDYFDRGPQNDKIAEWLCKHYSHENIVLLKGNHDIDFINFLKYGNDPKSMSLETYLGIEHMAKNNGLSDTFEQLAPNTFQGNYEEMHREIMSTYPNLLKMYESAKWYHITENAVYTHASLPSDYKTRTDKQWEKSVWMNSFDWAHTRPALPTDKKIYIGHFSLSNIDSWDGKSPVEINNIVFCDGGLAWGYDGIIVEGV